MSLSRDVILNIGIRKFLIILLLLILSSFLLLALYFVFPEVSQKGKKINVSIKVDDNYKSLKDRKFTRRLNEVCEEDLKDINIVITEYIGNPTKFPYKVSNDKIEYEYAFRFLEENNIFLTVGINKEKIKQGNSLDILNKDLSNIILATCLMKKELSLGRNFTFNETVFRNFPRYLNKILAQEQDNKYSLIEL